MSPLPELIDPWRWAARGTRASGQIATAGLQRLAGLIDGAAPAVEVELGIERDEDGRIIVSGSARTELRVRCQRCLEPMPYPVDVRFRLAVVESPSEAERLPEALDPLVITEGRLRVLDVIEDELLLSLPLVPRHAQGQCSLYGQGERGPREETAVESPFSVLAGLKRQPDSKT